MLLLGTLSAHALAQDRRFAGTRIHIGALYNNATNVMLEFLDEFEAETGIEVTVEQMANQDLFKKVTVESVAETGYFDIVRLSPHFIGSFAEPGWIVPLDEYVERDNFDLSDFLPAALEVLGKRPGDERLWALPQDANTGLFAYRTDLFGDPAEKRAFKERYGYELRPPETFREWRDAAEFFTRDTNGDGEMDLYGFGHSQQAGGPAFIWALVPVWSMGGEVLNKNETEVTLNSEATIQGLHWAKDFQQFQPPGVMGWGLYDIVTPMSQGRLAMSLQLFSHAPHLLDPEESSYRDRIAFKTIPRYEDNGRGYEAGKYIFGGGGLALHAHSENKEAAWMFMKWMLGRQKAAEYAMAGTIPPRRSVLNNEAVLNSNPAYGKILPAFLASLDHVAKGRPKLPESSSLLKQLGEAWHEVVLGEKEPPQAVADAHKRMEDILEQAGY